MTDKIKDYESFLLSRNAHDFWRKAKQIEFTDKAILKIQKFLTTDFKYLTTRNSMTLRILGLIINEGNNKLSLSEAGYEFVNLEEKDKSKLLDSQVYKVYLNCPEINPYLALKVIPIKTLLKILLETKYFTFEEYKIFICWIRLEDQISLVIDLINDFRQGNEDDYLSVFQKKVENLRIEDFDDNIKRFFNMLLLSSFIKKTIIGDEQRIILNIDETAAIKIIRNYRSINFRSHNYYEYLTSQTLEEFINILEVKEEEKLPEPGNVNPEEIYLEVETGEIPKGKQRKRSVEKGKVDYDSKHELDKKHGDHAEKVVVKHEVDFLIKNGKKELSERVKQVSLEDDSLGYDVLSFDLDNNEKHIEVKGVRGKVPSSSFSFYMSRNELDIAKNDKKHYLCVVFDYLSNEPKISNFFNIFKNKEIDLIIEPKIVTGALIIPIKFFITIFIKQR